jgi:putative flippase GtrA
MISSNCLKNILGIIISLVLLAIFLPIAILSHTGYKEGYITYFIIASFIAPLAPLIFTQKFKTGFVQSVIMVILTMLLTWGYWWYRDLPQGTYCDGPCGGQFSFENYIDYSAILIAGLGGIILGSIVRFIKSKLSIKKLG